MPIPGKHLEAFANKGKPKKDDGDEKKGGKKPPPKFGGKDKAHHDKPGEPEHEHGEDGEDIDVDAIGERVQDGKGDKRLMRLAKNVDEDHNPPHWALDEDIWDKAKDAVEDKWDEYDQPYAVVAHVYEKMGGTIGG